MSDLFGIVWLVILLCANAFFVGAEFAVISARRSQIEPLVAAGRRGAKSALWAMEHATLMLAACQLGITVCSLLILNVSEPAIHHLVAIPLDWMGLGDAVVAVTSFIIALAFVSYLHVVFGEMVPKNLSFSNPGRFVLLLAPPLVTLGVVLRPIIIALNACANVVLRICRVEPRAEAGSAYTLDEVATIVNQSTRQGVLEDTSGALTAAFEFTYKKVLDVTVPMKSLVSIPEGSRSEDVERAVAHSGFSRYVVFSEASEPVGYVHLKDVLDLKPGETLPAKRIRHIVSIFDNTDLEDALATMRRSGAHLARVFDADGTSRGVLFLEDILEEIVGEVRDATRK